MQLRDLADHHADGAAVAQLLQALQQRRRSLEGVAAVEQAGGLGLVGAGNGRGHGLFVATVDDGGLAAHHVQIGGMVVELACSQQLHAGHLQRLGHKGAHASHQ